MAMKDVILGLFRLKGGSSNDVELTGSASFTAPAIAINNDTESDLDIQINGVSKWLIGTFAGDGLFYVYEPATDSSPIVIPPGSSLVRFNVPSIVIGESKTPASAAAAGGVGEIAWDANFLYVCVNTNTWKRVAIATW
jgi:hypothetical protein